MFFADNWHGHFKSIALLRLYTPHTVWYYMESVILAGGLGTRLLPYTLFAPKPMLPLGEKPMLEHIIEWNVKNGISDIILCVSYLGRIIKDYFEDGASFGVSIRYATSGKPLATAGQLRTAAPLISDTFVCMYGDSMYDFDLKEMILRHKKQRAFITMGLHEHNSSIPYGVIETDAAGRVVAWREKPKTVSQINMGCYVMDPDVMSYIPPDKPWGMDTVIEAALGDDKTVFGHLGRGMFRDVGSYESYMAISKEYRERLGAI